MTLFKQKKPLKWLSIRDVSESVVGTIVVWSIFVDFRLNCVARDFAQAPKSKCHLCIFEKTGTRKRHIYIFVGCAHKKEKGNLLLGGKHKAG